MKDLLFDQFQDTVSECLVRHKSILDLLTKFQESSARVNRAFVKSVTDCGCVKVDASRHVIPDNMTLAEVRDHLDSHLRGTLCEHCREVIDTEVGQTLFYLTAILQTLDLNLYDSLLKEHKRLATLGVFNFS